MGKTYWLIYNPHHQGCRAKLFNSKKDALKWFNKNNHGSFELIDIALSLEREVEKDGD